MLRLFKSFLFKISRDLTFRITLIIGVALAFFMTLLYFALDNFMNDTFVDVGGSPVLFCTGQSMLVNSVSPVQNFGIAIPVNLISFICLEFSHGTIRNKIIAGNSKFKIYSSLLIGGLVFAFSLLFAYMGLSTLLGTIFGGFDLEKTIIVGTSVGGAKLTGDFIWKVLLICVVCYIGIVSFTVFFATLFRNIGPTIPVVMMTLVLLYVGGVVVGTMDTLEVESNALMNAIKILDPLYSLGNYSINDDGYAFITNTALISSLIVNLTYAAIFFAGGAVIFAKRDVK